VKLDLALRELPRSENSLLADLLTMADRRKANHEIYHVAHDLVRWSGSMCTSSPRSASAMA
jgi:hypothetical protein